MNNKLAFMQADGPMTHYVGASIVLGTIASFIIILTSIVHGPDDMQQCISSGGTWAHTLAQPEKHDGTSRNGDVYNDAHYNDTCTLPGGKK